MNQPPTRGDGVRRVRRLRRGLAALLAGGVGLVLAPIGAATPGAPAASGEIVTTAAAARNTCPTTRPIRVAEANIKSGMSARRTNADVATVYRNTPDFVAFNEVPYRSDALLAPAGYEIWRSPGRYIGANAVTWRSDRWRPIARGTMYVSNVPGKVAGQTSEWGIRYANWATLTSTDGCQTISVVAYHVAPVNRITKGLLVPSVRRLGELTRYLSASGPVILAGDLNSHYKARTYPRAELAAAGMTPTYDITGTYLPTGDHHNATIDYVFVNRREQFGVTSQVTQELHSDHDLLLVDLVFDRTVPVPAVAPNIIRHHVVNVPDSPLAKGRKEVLKRLVKTIRRTPRGQIIRYSTDVLTDAKIGKVLLRAHRNGVRVKFVTTNPRPNNLERALMRKLGTTKGGRSWAVTGSARKASRLGVPPTVLLSTSSMGARHVRIDVDQASTRARMARLTTRAQMFTQREDFKDRKRDFNRLAR